MNTFSAYSDESGIFDHRFQSIAVVSGKEEMLEELRNKLQEEIDNRQILEVKFSEIIGYNSPIAKAARQFIKIAVKDFAINRKIRIETGGEGASLAPHEVNTRPGIIINKRIDENLWMCSKRDVFLVIFSRVGR